MSSFVYGRYCIATEIQLTFNFLKHGIPLNNTELLSHRKHFASLKQQLVNSFRTSQETHYISATKLDRLMLFRKTNAVYCERIIRNTNTVSVQNAEFLNVREGANSMGLKECHSDLQTYVSQLRNVL
jgi:hypothetical protein